MIPGGNLLKIKTRDKGISSTAAGMGNLNKFEMVSSETSKPGPVQFPPPCM